jgi:effector-binding domain-containing protein
MTMIGHRALCLTAILLIAAPALGQTSAPGSAPAGVPLPMPVETQPLPPPAVSQPAQAEPSQPALAPSAPPATTPGVAVPIPAPAPAADVGKPAPAASGLTTLAPPPADPMIPDQVEMTSRPALIAKGQSSWDDGYDKLKAAFRRLEAECAKDGIKVTGRPVTLFVETDDNGFRYEAVLPIDAVPAQRPSTLPNDMRFGATPEGKAVRFVYKGPYDDIDSTYEAITAYLDLKGIEAKDTLIEEYLNWGADSGDAELELQIYVQPKR